ncbi:MAG TPA: succinylglutamate desuccinylase/aspartoacylase family protein [Acetobacteraceae bacterium]|nr:succinylglutamate desuccinylase/aspartoacylase family protein [Acetobacteraceae bacterium]
MPTPHRSRLIAEVDFEKDGVQHGFVRLFHSVHASAYGFIPIPIAVIRNGTGPTLLLISGTHGDEYEGQVALCNLVRSLKAEEMRGRVLILPAANLPAAVAGQRTSPIDAGNLNRIFPGDPDGGVTEQIAYFIEHALIPLADFVCDLHSGGSSLMYLPSALIKRAADPARTAALIEAVRAFGAPHAYIARAAQGQGADRTTSGAADRQGVLSMGTELGGGGTVTPAALRVAERGVRNLMVHLGLLPPERRVEPPAATQLLEVAGPDYFAYASEDGLYQPLVELGHMVREGQPAAMIHTPETPWARPATVRFARDGLVLCKRMPGRTRRGDCLFHLATEYAG